VATTFRAGPAAVAGADHRTPWECGVRGEELVRHERDMMVRSAVNLRALGLME
jgi:hypothetical protein